jgi:hypothetical protein
MKQIFEKPWSFAVMLDEPSGTHYLDVLCGGAGLYEVRIRLMPDEVKEAQDRWDVLDSLALKVCRNPEAFSERREYI